MRVLAIFVLILLSWQTSFSQTKTIKGDTVYWFKINKMTQKAFKLRDFEKSTGEFNFRIHYYGQLIEISKNGVTVDGRVTNYTYHTRKANRRKPDTLFQEIIITPEKAKSIYGNILNSGILDLPTDKEIKNWHQGMDGITYFIEYSDRNDYWIKNYWTPSAQDSIPEAIVVLDFIKSLDDTLKLKEIYQAFENGLPKQGCYNSGGMTNMCYIPNNFEFGYSGATKLPLGFNTQYTASYISKTKVNSGVALQYNFNDNKFYHLNFQVSKWSILNKDPNFPDFIAYNYQIRKLDIDKLNNKFKNHQIQYGLNLKNNSSIGIGLDYLINDSRTVGVHFRAHKYFSKANMSTVLTSSVFSDQINYKAQILKSINLNQNFLVRRLTLGLTYEDCMHYRDLYFSFQVAF